MESTITSDQLIPPPVLSPSISDDEVIRTRSRSRSTYEENISPSTPVRPRSSSLRGMPPQPVSPTSGNNNTESNTNIIGGSIDNPPIHSPRQRRNSRQQKGGLSKKTLNIVNNLQGVQKNTMTRREREEVEEERRLAEEEKKRQALKKGPIKDDCDYMIRILLLGDSGVGKTSLMLRYSEDQFAPNLLSTAGVDFKVRHMDINGKRVKCQIWDTAGQEKFHVITRTYYRGAQGIALVYDCTDPDSFKNVNYWMANIQQHADEKVQKILLGNKIDLVEDKEISYEMGQNISKEYGMNFFETSAKDGLNVADSFYSIAKDIIMKLEEQAALPDELKIKANKRGKRKGKNSNSNCVIS